MKAWEIILWAVLIVILIVGLAWGVVTLATRPPHDTYRCEETSSTTFTCTKH